MTKRFSRNWICFCLCFICFSGCDQPAPLAEKESPAASTVYLADDQDIIARAFATRQSGIFVQSHGQVERILSDDLKGDRHQRFILQLDNGQTLLFAHNMDIAPRIDSLTKGDFISFRGMYEWNDKGGVIHWTHHDPGFRREGGWIDHEGRRYE